MKRRAADYLNMPEIAGLTEDRIMFVVEYMKDLNPARASETIGLSAEYGYKIVKEPAVAAAIAIQLKRRLQEAAIDTEWVLTERVDNQYLARQQGDLKASNTALQMIGKLSVVDAFAADKVIITDDEKIRERLERGRQRIADAKAPTTERFF